MHTFYFILEKYADNLEGICWFILKQTEYGDYWDWQFMQFGIKARDVQLTF